MRAAILEEPGRFVLSERPTPDLAADDVLVRTHICGICTSELDMWEGNSNVTFPRFAGHEVSGVIEALGSNVKEFKEGDRVALYAEGEGFADYVSVPREWTVKLRPEVPFHEALGEPIACAVNGVRKVDSDFGETVCIVGCGFMGLMMVQLFRLRSASMIVAVDTRDSILETARTLGATHSLNPQTVDVEEAVRELTAGKGVDIGVEAAGNQATLDLTSRVVRMEGKLEVFGFHQGGPREVDWGYWNWMAFDVVNGHTRTQSMYVDGMRIGLDLVADGKLNMTPLVTHLFPVDEINLGFETAAAKKEGFVKGVVVFEAERSG